MQYTKHSFNFFPEIPREEFEGLKNSIQKGFDTKLGKIILFENQILDGWNRYRACVETGTQPIFDNFVGNEQDAFWFSIKANQERRHLSKSQLAAVAIDAEPIWQAIQAKVEAERIEKIRIARLKQEEEKRENERKEKERLQEQIRQENIRIERENALRLQKEKQEALRKEQEAKNEQIRIAKEKADAEQRKALEEKQEALRKEREELAIKQKALQEEQEQISFQRQEAERLEIERREKEKQEKEKEMVTLMSPSENKQNLMRDKLASAFGTSGTYINEAKKLKETSPERFEAVRNGEKTITEVAKEIKIENRQAEIAKQKAQIENDELPVLKGVFDVISIDPPWNYGREYDPETSRVANPYPEMSVEEIKAIELPLNDDAVIFLWTTHAFLPHAFDILKHWNLEYKATLVWDKERMGMGAWLRMQCEFCLVAIKGKPFWNNTTERDIIKEARREHSRKPDAFFSLVDKICAGRKLEYFSREKRNGWEIFGNDINKF